MLMLVCTNLISNAVHVSSDSCQCRFMYMRVIRYPCSFWNSSSMSFGDSVAVFKQRATAIGLSDENYARFKGEDLDTMAKFAFACNYAPGASDDKAFKELMSAVTK